MEIRHSQGWICGRPNGGSVEGDSRFGNLITTPLLCISRVYMSIVMISSAWCTAEPKPQWVCIAHEGGFREMYFLSVTVGIRRKIRSSRYACTHVWRVIRGT